MSAIRLPESSLPSAWRETLLDKAEELEELVQPSASSDEHPERELDERRARRLAWYSQIEDQVLDIANSLPAGTEDYEARKLFEYLTELRRAIEADPETTDQTGKVALACAKMHDVLARMARRVEHTALEDPQQAAKYLFDHLAPLSASDFAKLLDVSTKTIGSWKRGGPIRTHPRRVQLVAKLCQYLLPATTPLGVLMWFRNPADILDGKSALELLQGGEPTPEVWSQLVDFARGARGQLAS
jgi:hypothetical protein